ncbi:MAG: hypothetical protein ACI8ZM_001981 [Crocinitomix sp.]|jgi:hypothetical protein
MKNTLLILAIFLLPILSYCQSDTFQGEVKYDITYEGEGAEYMSMIGFSEYHYYFGDQKTRLKLSGGMAYLLNDFITNNVTGEKVMIDDVNKVVYSIEPDEAGEEEENENALVVKTKDKEKIMGYKCTKYIVTVKTDSSEETTEYWTTNKINVNADVNIGLVSGLNYSGVEGFPLRISWTFDDLTMTQEATYINTDIPATSKFEIPSTYAAKDFSESPLMKMTEEEEEE